MQAGWRDGVQHTMERRGCVVTKSCSQFTEYQINSHEMICLCYYFSVPLRYKSRWHGWSWIRKDIGFSWTTEAPWIWRGFSGKWSKGAGIMRICCRWPSESILTNFKNQVWFLKTLRRKLPKAVFPMGYVKIGRLLFECILHGKDCNKKNLLPCFYKF